MITEKVLRADLMLTTLTTHGWCFGWGILSSGLFSAGCPSEWRNLFEFIFFLHLGLLKNRATE